MTVAAPITVDWASATHPGLRRRSNEDSHIAQPPLFLVADGMGGHAAGDVASGIVVAECAVLAAQPSVSVEQLQGALMRARIRVEEIGGGGRPAGSTLTGVAVSDVDGAGYWLIANVGDSRTYRLADGRLTQITVDHSMVQELIASSRADLAARTARNVITRAIGAGSDGVADIWMIPAASGDRLLVCSDGLTSEVSDEEIAAILTTTTDPRKAVTQLMSAALQGAAAADEPPAGGRDNITVIVVDARDVSFSEDDEDTSPGTRWGGANGTREAASRATSRGLGQGESPHLGKDSSR